MGKNVLLSMKTKGFRRSKERKVTNSEIDTEIICQKR